MLTLEPLTVKTHRDKAGGRGGASGSDNTDDRAPPQVGGGQGWGTVLVPLQLPVSCVMGIFGFPPKYVQRLSV